MRRVQAAGDFATVLRRGDPERGSLLLIVGTRGRHIACLERVLSFDKGYVWQGGGPAASLAFTQFTNCEKSRTW